MLTLKVPITTATNVSFDLFKKNKSEKTSIDISYELSAWQTIHMKCQNFFLWKK